MPPIDPVKFFAAVLYPDVPWLERAVTLLERQFGPVDRRGTPASFDHTTYYESEMGSGLNRVILGFETLAPPGGIVNAKHATRDLEAQLSQRDQRRVNLDVGYLDEFKVTLASFKARGNKVYLDRDVWLDVQLYFERGQWHPLPWTFPDFRAGRYAADFLRLRSRYREQVRGQRLGAPPE